MRPRLFQVGFNRCGTASLHRFLRLNGIASVHHAGGRLAIAMDANLRAGRHVLAGWERFEAFLDMSFLRAHVHVEMYKRWDVLLEQVPEARFILNLRDVDRWVASRLAMGPWTEWRRERPARGFGPPWDAPHPWPVARVPPFRERYRRCHGLAGLDEVVAHWRADWARHVAAVRASVPADRLLAFDIEREPPEALCRFVGLDASAARHWGHENPGPGRLGRALAGWAPRTLTRRVPDSVRRAARHALRRR
ncbi:MAG: chromosome partition protein MukE [Alphaproteobacteria bacterium]|nr:chromosome partition protein MukE [Alphaproteobacteria bacterium]